jgi:predicted CXXCH cytochrome family protein
MFCAVAHAAPPADYVGSKTCASCHQDAYKNWEKSHHWQAMQPANADTVLGDFNNASFEHYGVTSKFSMVDGRYTVRTDNAAGKMEDFTIAYTFGFYPLQQYLIAFPDGRYQTLSVAWDSRPKAEGGQRWFHLYPDEAIPHDDPLHWTGAFQNWNSRCASCHSTDLHKNYDVKTDTYDTQWAEVTVGCESCHGAGSQHLAWAAGNTGIADKGLILSLDDRASWVAADGKPTLHNSSDLRPQNQLGSCAGCHSRRQEIAHRQVEEDYLQSYSPSLLLEGLYFPDGQINDEVYVYGSFLQSKMHEQGVVCSNCHEPHSLQLRVEGNGLCAQCHAPATFDTPEHHHHPADSTGAQCVNCHMPERTYMVVDPRRDHSFKVPQPVLSGLLNTPNACTTCHTDKDNAWAKQALQNWLGHQPLRDTHAPTLAIARGNNPAALKPLLELAREPAAAPIVRATAVRETGRFGSTEMLTQAIEHLYDDNALIRGAAVEALEILPADQRYTLLSPLVDDPVRSVRIAVGAALAGTDMGPLNAQQSTALNSLFAEYVTALEYSADMPGTQLNLGSFYTSRRQYPQAHAAYEHALRLSPGYLPAMLNLADLYRAMGEEEKARPLLEQAIKAAPAEAPAYHALGLLMVRQKQVAESLPYLQKAAELAPAAARYSYVYGVALHSTGRVDEALKVLASAAEDHPNDPQIQGALKAYSEQAGKAPAQ